MSTSRNTSSGNRLGLNLILNFLTYFNFAQVQSMDDNCGEWVESMSMARVVVSRRQV